MAFLDCQQTTFREDMVLEADEGTVSFHMWKPVSRSLGSLLDLRPSRHNQSRRQIGTHLEEFWDLISQYCSRTLSKEEDVLNALTGVLKTFMPTLGEFRFGMPIHFLGLMLLWETEDKLLVVRRTGTDIPSWSWAAWQGYKSRYDAMGGFLTNAASPVQFFELADRDETRPITSSRLIADPIYLERPYPRIKDQCRPSSPLPKEKLESCKLTSPFHKYLLFWTSTARFIVERRPILSDQCDYAVRNKQGISVGTLALSPEWRISQPDRLEFIVLAVLYGHLLHLMAIEWVDGIARRVQAMGRPVGQQVWLDANPVQKLIVLG
jgi:hypothetical protein